MTNVISAWLAGLIALFFLGDALFNHGAAAFFLAGKTLDLIEWVAFWR